MVSSLTGLSPAEWACDEQALETGMTTCHEMMEELMVLARAMGYDESLIPSNAPEDIVADARIKLLGTDFVPSALLDVRLKIPFELEVVMGYVYREAKSRQIPTPVSVTWVKRCCLNRLAEGGLCLQNAHCCASSPFEELRSALKLRPQPPVWRLRQLRVGSRDNEFLFPYSVYCNVEAHPRYIVVSHTGTVSSNHDPGYQSYAYSKRTPRPRIILALTTSHVSSLWPPSNQTLK
jgi:Ketopantoate reductase PanE/ApbA C terminal